MARIALNPYALAQTASALREVAGEYQLIGAQVTSCDCSCMPPDVAAVVESATVQARTELSALSEYLSVEASDLAARADISHDGGAPTYSAGGLGGGQSSISIGPLAGSGPAAAPGFLTIPSAYGVGAAVPSGTISIGASQPGVAPVPSGMLSIGASQPGGAALASGTLSIGASQPGSAALASGTLSIGASPPPWYTGLLSNGATRYGNNMSGGIPIPVGSAVSLPGDELISEGMSRLIGSGMSVAPGAPPSTWDRHTLGPSPEDIASPRYSYRAGPFNWFRGPSP